MGADGGFGRGRVSENEDGEVDGVVPSAVGGSGDDLDWTQFRVAVVDDNHINTKILIVSGTDGRVRFSLFFILGVLTLCAGKCF